MLIRLLDKVMGLWGAPKHALFLIMILLPQGLAACFGNWNWLPTVLPEHD